MRGKPGTYSAFCGRCCSLKEWVGKEVVCRRCRREACRKDRARRRSRKIAEVGIDAVRLDERVTRNLQRFSHPERYRESAKRWRGKNPLYYVASGHGTTVKVILAIREKQKGLCGLTGLPLTDSAEIDHIVPKARGGTNAPENLRWVNKEANRAKRDLLDSEFLELCRAVVAHFDRGPE